MYSHRRWLEAGNFGFRKYRNCSIHVAKTKALISFAVTAKLICSFVIAYGDCWFSHAVAQLMFCILTMTFHSNLLGKDFVVQSVNVSLMYQFVWNTILQGPPLEEESKDSARSKWGAGGGAELRLAEKSLEEEPEDSARPKWGAGVNLRQMTLEETASQMEG